MMSRDDARYLDLLGWAHYILGALTLLCGSFPVIHLVVGIGILTGRMQGPPPGTQGEPMVKAVGGLFVVVAAAIILVAWALGIATMLAGRYLRERRRRMFCTVVAAVNCMSFPVGTAVGVLTIILLNKPDVSGVFDAPEPA
ncbi:MAG: hypothetical protein SF028_14870 [Candidatus Sumerlaeia bacterium]|nr:hypothetical protein [Candidatus Sumerlaeia bacterium]